MSYLIDAIAIVGGAFVASGVFLLFGAGYALIVSGMLFIAFALKAAKTQEDSHVSNRD